MVNEGARNWSAILLRGWKTGPLCLCHPQTHNSHLSIQPGWWGRWGVGERVSTTDEDANTSWTTVFPVNVLLVCQTQHQFCGCPVLSVVLILSCFEDPSQLYCSKFISHLHFRVKPSLCPSVSWCQCRHLNWQCEHFISVKTSFCVSQCLSA